MRVVVSLLHHFRRTPSGTVYPYSVFDYEFWRLYLDVFDAVTVFARVESIPEVEPASMPPQASGPGVTFCAIPEFKGARQYIRAYPKLRSLARTVSREESAFVLRSPAYLSTMLWHGLRGTGHPYGVEVVGDPWEATAPGALQSVLRPWVRHRWTWDQKRLCRHATVAAYVTEGALQRRYPSRGWTAHYSSIELPGEWIIGPDALEARLGRIEAKARTRGPWRAVFVGSLWHLGKSPDVLIDAVGECKRRGLGMELVMVGDGSLRSSLESRARQLGIGEQVSFLGQLPPWGPVYEQMDRADVLVLPSRSEGLPRVIIEAMARGLPCISSPVGGIPELLPGEYLVTPGNSLTLADAICRLTGDLSAMQEAARRNLKKAAEFRTDVLQARRVELYQRLRNATEAWHRQRPG